MDNCGLHNRANRHPHDIINTQKVIVTSRAFSLDGCVFVFILFAFLVCLWLVCRICWVGLAIELLNVQRVLSVFHLSV